MPLLLTQPSLFSLGKNPLEEIPFPVALYLPSLRVSCKSQLGSFRFKARSLGTKARRKEKICSFLSLFFGFVNERTFWGLKRERWCTTRGYISGGKAKPISSATKSMASSCLTSQASVTRGRSPGSSTSS